MLPYSDPRELLGEILRHGLHVRVEAPEELIELVRDTVKSLAAIRLTADSPHLPTPLGHWR